jgi:Type II CAAX prenyl endopeptidase Rce1-like
VPGLVLAACEEIGWRGYLTPALSVRGMSRIANHLTVGLVWTVWRVPLLLGANGDTTLGFAPLFLLGNLALAVILGEMRLRAGTIWPVILTRGIGINGHDPGLDRLGRDESASVDVGRQTCARTVGRGRRRRRGVSGNLGVKTGYLGQSPNLQEAVKGQGLT